MGGANLLITHCLKPRLHSFAHFPQPRILRITVRHAPRQFRHRCHEYPILSIPVHDDPVLVHQSAASSRSLCRHSDCFKTLNQILSFPFKHSWSVHLKDI